MKDKKTPWEKLGFKTQYEYQTDWCKRNGYKNLKDYRLAKGIDVITDEWRVKDIEDGCPNEAKEIPFAPGYYIMPDSTIYHKSRMRKKWIIIKQQVHKSGYCAFQPYIDGKRHVKYVHRALMAAFYGDRDNNYEAHHQNGDKQDNTLENVVWMDKYEHRRLARGPYKK